MRSDRGRQSMGNDMGSLSSNYRDASSDFQMKPSEKLPLTDQCHHYRNKGQVPWDIQKYFSQRYSIFSWYDEGIYMTDDAWFGVTPEPIANQIAQDISKAFPKNHTIIDLFAGAGGNAIAFALSNHWSRIIAVEQDASTLACAQHNAEINGVDPDFITWVHGDSFRFLDTLLNQPEQLHPDLRVDLDHTILFASPPWGGPGYRTDEIFDLHTMEPYNLNRLHSSYERLDHALYLPRTSDIRQVAKLVPDGEKIDAVQYCMEGASKALVFYIPGNAPKTPEG